MPIPTPAWKPTCRNDGFIEHDGIRWLLAGPVPLQWRGRNPIVGDLAMDGTSAVFIAHPGPPPVPGEVGAEDEAESGSQSDGGLQSLDGFTVALSSDAAQADCHPWSSPDGGPPSGQIGRLDCDDRGVNEVVIPDEGQSPEDLAFDAHPQTVAIQSDGPPQWSGLDGGAWVVVALFLGDADVADWQIFTCSEP